MSAKRIVLGAAAVLLATTCLSHAQSVGRLTNQPPEALLDGFLMTDGTVIYQGGNTILRWYKLTPDNTGSYLHGTWSEIASLPANYGPYAFTGSVLADGRLLIVGGEYLLEGNQLVFAFTNKGAVYDPRSNNWTMISPPPRWGTIGDSPGAVLPDGRFLLGQKFDKRLAILDPKTLTWTSARAAGKTDWNAEEGWTLMPDGSIFTVDVRSHPHAERYLPGDGQWIGAGNTPVDLQSPPAEKTITWGNGRIYHPPGEVGPGMLRPDGTVFATGGQHAGADRGHTAIYHPGASRLDQGTWSTGPDFQKGDNAGDNYAALLPNGNVAVETSTYPFFAKRAEQRLSPRAAELAQPLGAEAAAAPSAFKSGYGMYEFDGTNLTPTIAFGGSYHIIVLPTGELDIAGFALYTNGGNYAPDWAPRITSYQKSISRGGSYPIFGQQFNGLSMAAAFGDEDTTATNYPLVRITNDTTGHVFYVRTHDHSAMGVATGAATVSTTFDVPDGIEVGPSQLEVVANGIPSTPVAVSVQ